jgi:hypothetical protein
MNTIARPFLPPDRYTSSAPAPRPSDAIIRAIAAECIAAAGGESPDAVLKERWPRDEVAKSFVTRASTTPTTTATASALSTTATADMVLSIGPQSAGSALMAQGLMLNFDRSQTISVPNVLSSATFSNIVAEGNPIPVYEVRSGPSTLLTLQTIKGIAVFTREVLESNNVEAITRQVLAESIGLSLDALMFTASAGGLLNGIIAGTESSNADHAEAMLEDLATLLSAVAPVAAGFPIAIVTSPAQAVKLKLRLLTARDPGFMVLASSAIADRTLVAIAGNTLVAATSPIPTFDISTNATVVMETVPSQIAAGGTLAAGETRSLFQTDSIGLRVRFGVAWALRSATGIAFLEDCIW